ncbi:unnamed protein product [Acanthosepion pharaonis]|uniref:Uncharacterized protein n=1 Tax=Acanthosepion pharaonis TaxID=158019 RepID=A0A812BFW8_ACAPH|nr:unnamed protein product [Sepia pharaonis]
MSVCSPLPPPSHRKTLFIYFTFSSSSGTHHSVHLSSLPHTARHCSSISPFLAAVAITHRNSVHLCLPPSHCKALFIYFTFSSSSGVMHHVCSPLPPSPSHCKALFIYFTFSSSSGDYASHCSSISPFLAAVEITHHVVFTCLPSLTSKTLSIYFTFSGSSGDQHRSVFTFSLHCKTLGAAVHRISGDCIVFTSASSLTARHCSSISPFLAAVEITHRNSVHLCLPPSPFCKALFILFHLFFQQQWSRASSLPTLWNYASYYASVHLPASSLHCKALFIYFTFSSSSGDYASLVFTSASSLTLQDTALFIKSTVHLVFTSSLLTHCSTVQVFKHRSSPLPPPSLHTLFNYFTFPWRLRIQHLVFTCSPSSHCKALLAITFSSSIIVIVFLCLPSLTLQDTQQWGLRIMFHLCLPPSHCKTLFIHFTFLAAVEIAHHNSVHLCLPPSHCKALFIYFTFSSSSGDYASANSVPLPPSLTLQGTQQWRLRIVIVFTSASPPHTARHCSSISPFLAAVEITHHNSVHLCLPPPCTSVAIKHLNSVPPLLPPSLQGTVLSISPFLAAVEITHRNSVHLCLPLSLQDAFIHFTFSSSMFTSALPPSHCKALFIYFSFLAAVAIAHRNSVHPGLPQTLLFISPFPGKTLFIYFTFPSAALLSITHRGIRSSVHLCLPPTLQDTQQWRLRIVIVFTCLPPSHCKALFIYFTFSSSSGRLRDSVHCLPSPHCKTLFIYFTFSSSTKCIVFTSASPPHCKTLFIYFTFSSSSGDYASHCSSISPFLAAVEITHRNSVPLPPSLTLQDTQQWRLRIVNTLLPPSHCKPVQLFHLSSHHTASSLTRHCSSISPFLAAVEIAHTSGVQFCLPRSHCKALFNPFHLSSSSVDYASQQCLPLPPPSHRKALSAEITHRNMYSPLNSNLPPAHTARHSAAITHRNTANLCLPLPHTARHCSTISPFLAAVAITHRNSVHLCSPLPPQGKTVHHFTFLAAVGITQTAVAITHRNSVYPLPPSPHCKTNSNYLDFHPSISITHRNSVHLSSPLTLQGTTHYCSSISEAENYASHSVHLCLPPPSHCKALSIYFTFSSSSGDYASVFISVFTLQDTVLFPFSSSTITPQQWRSHRNSVLPPASPPHTLQGTVHLPAFQQQERLRIAIVFTSASLTLQHCNYFTFLAVEFESISLPPSPHTARHSAVEITHRNRVHLCLPPLTLQDTVHLFHLSSSSETHTQQWRLRIATVFTSASSSHCKALFIYSTFSSSSGDYVSASVHLPPPPHTARHCSIHFTFLAAVSLRIVIVFTSASPPSHCKTLSIYFNFLAAVEIAHRNSVHLCSPSHCKALFIYFIFSAAAEIAHRSQCSPLPLSLSTARHCSSISPFLEAENTHHTRLPPPSQPFGSISPP